MRIAYLLTSLGRGGAKRQVKTGAVTERKCSVVTNGIDCDIFKASAARRREARAGLNGADRFVWIAAGRLTPAKNFPNLLKAFSLLQVEFPLAELWIAG